MANFDSFFPTLLKHEGGFVNDPVDPGGATNKGVTFATFKLYAPDLLGIAHPSVDDLKQLTDQQAGKIYKKQYWDKVRGDAIDSQEIANFLFDFQVNAGANATNTLQRVLNALGAKPQLVVDGSVGPGTLAAINGADQAALYKAFKEARRKYYQDLVQRRPALNKFLNGWMNRVNSFPDAIAAPAKKGGA